ncbi:MAG: hypothetical protein JNL48_06605 [Acidobacteria bacterium]|nr:hypothetical protein [Acidobacteriota bacterium]
MSRTIAFAALIALALTTTATVPAAQSARDTAEHGPHGANDASLAARVREATADFRDINQAVAAGYARFGGCVSGPEVGAMGVHYVNNALVDGTLDVTRPEALIYEYRNGTARLVGVEFITPAPVWDAQSTDVPVLAGQHLQFVGAPNRYRLPGLYELHVWAWRDNPNGTYVDWNPKVSCDGEE